MSGGGGAGVDGGRQRMTDGGYQTEIQGDERREERRGGGGGEMKLQIVIKMERGGYRDKTGQRDRMQSEREEGDVEKQRSGVSEGHCCSTSLSALSAVQLRSGPLQLRSRLQHPRTL